MYFQHITITTHGACVVCQDTLHETGLFSFTSPAPKSCCCHFAFTVSLMFMCSYKIATFLCFCFHINYIPRCKDQNLLNIILSPIQVKHWHFLNYTSSDLTAANSMFPLLSRKFQNCFINPYCLYIYQLVLIITSNK